MCVRIRALRAGGHSIAETARLAGSSPSQVKRVMALQRTAHGASGERRIQSDEITVKPRLLDSTTLPSIRTSGSSLMSMNFPPSQM